MPFRLVIKSVCCGTSNFLAASARVASEGKKCRLRFMRLSAAYIRKAHFCEVSLEIAELLPTLLYLITPVNYLEINYRIGGGVSANGNHYEFQISL
ncbi:hypothetical protein CDAR_463621 [Caerostris darwini]|uniref:Uncharacterized protein n=1 Tax=Caerostris darwini TaxID=1538125 RepID=A0AAV4TA39_9ARAC|nr:hypothetical protein CDAR_463621 [Caerostris darwini]